jgi:hypothetical protein
MKRDGMGKLCSMLKRYRIMYSNSRCGMRICRFSCIDVACSWKSGEWSSFIVGVLPTVKKNIYIFINLENGR